ncbi:MAG: hypothetical protein HFH34_12860 [Eubacterium sp.]|nr:hypothetical protein [Eubacterium sp.]
MRETKNFFGCADDAAGGGVEVRKLYFLDARTTLRAAEWNQAGRYTLGGLGQRCGERIANCD